MSGHSLIVFSALHIGQVSCPERNQPMIHPAWNLWVQPFSLCAPLDSLNFSQHMQHLSVSVMVTNCDQTCFLKTPPPPQKWHTRSVFCLTRNTIFLQYFGSIKKKCYTKIKTQFTMSCNYFSKNCTSYYTFVPKMNTSLVYNQFHHYDVPQLCAYKTPLYVSKLTRDARNGYSVSSSTNQCTLYESARNHDPLSRGSYQL